MTTPRTRRERLGYARRRAVPAAELDADLLPITLREVIDPHVDASFGTV
jgi:hypothetical protein